ncbi:MAG: leucyl/phenylalanyl-tRNA--protein transferase [Desulfobacteraceae bacterium]
MPVFRLSEQIEFPPPGLARSDGLLCVGGDLSTERLIEAYKNGIFPWYAHNEPILWWTPDPRLILYPRDIRVSRSLAKRLRKNFFSVSMDTAFEEVVRNCAHTRTIHGEDTWLTSDMIQAYTRLHEAGRAHSVECWRNRRLAGGLYGVSLGGVFFGESMFTIITDASKVALVHLARYLERLDYDLIDCQVATDHMVSMGAVEIPRQLFLKKVRRSLEKPDRTFNWSFDDTE